MRTICILDNDASCVRVTCARDLALARCLCVGVGVVPPLAWCSDGGGLGGVVRCDQMHMAVVRVQ